MSAALHITTEATALANRFINLFAGLDRAFGQYVIPPGARATGKGKVEGKATTVSARRLALADWEAHLRGERGLGVCPLKDDDTCSFGAIDIDVYPIDSTDIAEDCRRNRLPLILCRTKSGGVHGYLFLCEPVPADLLRRHLRRWAAALSYPDAEVFPKQDSMSDVAIGNWINMPYYGGKRSLRYAYDEQGKALGIDEFLNLAESMRITVEELEAIKVPDPAIKDETENDHHAPRSREYWRLMLEGVTEACGEPIKGRDCALASLAGKLISDRRIPLANIRPMLEEFNRELCDPPKNDDDIRRIWTSLKKKASAIPERAEAAPLVPIRSYLEQLANGVEAYTDQWLGLEFVDRYCSEVRYTAAWSRYHIWDGNRWKRDETLKAFSMAQEMCRDVARDVRGKKMRGHLLSGIARARALELSRENPAIAARIEDWDRDPWLLGTPGGTVDLRTGELRPGDPGDMITKSTAVTPMGECLLWLETLDGIFFGDQEVIGFVKRLFGYSLTGLTREELLAFFWGGGGNGKGTLVETVLYVVGDYGTTVPMTTLVQRRHQEHPTEIAKLHGKRLAVASETEEGDRWNTARIKALTGSDILTGRFMRNDYFDFRPEFQLLISSNNQPSFGTVDEAISRRLVMVPFLATFLKEQADVTRKARLKEEGPGILSWMIAGCLEWQHHGLVVPAKLRLATEGYLAAADDLSRFIDECCFVSEHAKSSTRELYAAFCTWCADHGIPNVLTRRAFTDRMTQRFASKHGKGNEVYLQGIRKAVDIDHF